MRGIDVVFHLAALIAIPFSYHSPDSYVETNVKGTLNVLQAARDTRCERILIASTSEVYGTAQFIPITEKHPRQPQSPYSASKIAADCLAESFFRSFDLPVTVVRPFNTYGPRQSARAVIPTIITQLLQGSKEIKLGDMRPTRDMVFVSDTVEAFLAIAKTSTLVGEDVNIATGLEVSVGDLARMLCAQIDSSAVVLQDQERLRPSKSEVFRLLGDPTKLIHHTGWACKTGIEGGLAETVSWFSEPTNLSRYKSNLYNL